jgi:hypothetical protein
VRSGGSRLLVHSHWEDFRAAAWEVSRPSLPLALDRGPAPATSIDGGAWRAGGRSESESDRYCSPGRASLL